MNHHQALRAVLELIRSLALRSGILILITALLFVPAVAAQSCSAEAVTANNLLEEAKTLMLAGDTETAVARINAAQELLTSCAPADVAPPAPTSTPMIADTDSAAAPAGFLVQAPEVDLEQAITFIAFAHTSIDAGAIDLYLDDSETPVISQLAYGEATPLIPFNGGSRRFNIRSADSGLEGEVLYTMTWDFVGNSSWVVTAAGSVDAFAFIVEPVSIVRSDYEGLARVRVVNLVRDLRVSVLAEGGTVFGDNLGWIGIKDTMTEPGAYVLNITGADGQNVGESVSFDFEAETTYMLYIIGQPESANPITILPVLAPQDVTRVRFMNTRADTVDIHARPGNNRLVESIAAGETTSYLTVASGAMTFLAYAPGTGPTGQELIGIALQLRPGRDITITLNAETMIMSEETLQQP